MPISWTKRGKPVLGPKQLRMKKKLEELNQEKEDIENEIEEIESGHKCIAEREPCPSGDPLGATARCAICGTDLEWWCPKNQKTHLCEYRGSEFCRWCGQPGERR